MAMETEPQETALADCEPPFHVVTVGWKKDLVDRLWKRIARKSEGRFSHILHPYYTLEEWEDGSPPADMHFFFVSSHERMPAPDLDFLASLEQEGVPTVHNMIMGDRVVSKLAYADALKYATFVARRLTALFKEIRPSAVIGGIDAIHGSLALAVARQLQIPWFTMHFSVIPRGMTCFCDRLSPAARVTIKRNRSIDYQGLAEVSIKEFEKGKLKADAYIEPAPLSISGKLKNLPRKLAAFHRIARKSRKREFLQYIENSSNHSITAALKFQWGISRARKALASVQTLGEVPKTPYVFFGLHRQPESSIDVWAPFYSKQVWIIELLARSIPPTHRLLVKIHKSNATKYSQRQLEEISALPGVEIVRPFADTFSFIRDADLVVAIQGTIGLEAALLGKPVIMLGESSVTSFPSASAIGRISDLPKLVNGKLLEVSPTRKEITKALATYLTPFVPAGHNNWRKEITEKEIDGYVSLLEDLKLHLTTSFEPSALHECR